MAGSIPREFIDDLLARVDITDVVGEHVQLRKTGGNFVGLCPFHNEKTGSFTVSPAKQFYHCFGCGAHGSAISFLMEYERLTFVEAIHDLAARIGVPVPAKNDGTPSNATGADPAFYELMGEVARFYRHQLREHDTAQQAVDYLKNRGLSGEVAKQFHIGYAAPGWDNLLRQFGTTPTTLQRLLEVGLLIKRDDGSGHYDRFRHRIMFPIRDRRGRVIGFGGRVLNNDVPKYLNSPESPIFHKGQELYGLYEALQAQRHVKRLIVVEGYMDVVALAQHGITNAVATLGTAITAAHLDRLFRTTEELVFCFDGDNAGRAAAWRALEHTLPAMREGRQARFMFLPEGEDPDTMVRKSGATELQQKLGEALPLTRYLLDKLIDDTDLSSAEGQARLVEKAKPHFAKIPDGLFKELVAQELVKRTRMSAATVERALGLKHGVVASDPRPRPATPPANAGLSPLKQAVGILLHYPELAQQVQDRTWMRDAPAKGLILLRDLLELLRAHPHLNTGAILEHWRGQEGAEQLSSLAAWDPVIPEEGRKQQLAGALDALRLRTQQHRVNELLNKPLEELSEQERVELIASLRNKRQQRRATE